MSRRDADQLVRALRRHWRATNRDYSFDQRRGHWHVLNADGQSIYSFGGTPSDGRFRLNTIRDLRRLDVVDTDFR